MSDSYDWAKDDKAILEELTTRPDLKPLIVELAVAELKKLGLLRTPRAESTVKAAVVRHVVNDAVIGYLRDKGQSDKEIIARLCSTIVGAWQKKVQDWRAADIDAAHNAANMDNFIRANAEMRRTREQIADIRAYMLHVLPEIALMAPKYHAKIVDAPWPEQKRSWWRKVLSFLMRPL